MMARVPAGDVRACREEIRLLHQELESTKQAGQKEGLEHLKRLLGSRPYLRVLDQMTLGLGRGSRLEGNSWPGLLAMFTKFAFREMSSLAKGSNKRKGVDAAISGCFKRLVEAAEDSRRRSGRGSMLVLRAQRLFEHSVDVLRMANLDSDIGRDYSRALTKHLLVSEAYMEHMSCDVAHELLDIYMTRAVETQLPLQEDLRTVMSAVFLLAQGMNCDMQPHLQERFLEFLCKCSRMLYARRGEPPLASHMVTINTMLCMNAFLLRNGPDVASRTHQLHLAASPLALWCLKNTRDQRLKDAVVTYMRIQMQLGGIFEAGDTLETLYNTMERLVKSQPDIWLTSPKGEKSLSINNLPLLDLVAAAFYYQSQTVVDQSDGDDEVDLSQQRRVRQRREDVLEDLMRKASASPKDWLPVASAVLRQFGSQLPHDTLRDWLGKCDTALMIHGKGTDGDRLQANSQEWLDSCFVWLGFFNRLAEAWPAPAEGLDSGSTTGLPAAHRSGMEGTWAAVWEVAFGLVTDRKAPREVNDAALSCCTSMLSRGTAQPHHCAAAVSWLGKAEVGLRHTADHCSDENALFSSKEALEFLGVVFSRAASSTQLEAGARTEVFGALMLHMAAGDTLRSCSAVDKSCRLALVLLDCLDWPAAARVLCTAPYTGQANEEESLESLQTGAEYLRDLSHRTQAVPSCPALPDIAVSQLHGRAAVPLLGALSSFAEIRASGPEAVLNALPEMLEAAAIATACFAGVHSHPSTPIALNGSWAKGAPLDRELQAHLRDCARGLARAATSTEHLTPRVMASLESLCGFLRRLQDASLATSEALLGGGSLLDSLEDAIIAEDSTSGRHDVGSGRQRAVTGFGDDPFDDDLDFGDAPSGLNGSGPAGAECQSARHRKLLEALRVLGQLSLDKTAVVLERLLQWAEKVLEGHLQEETLDALAVALAQLACDGSQQALSASLGIMLELSKDLQVHELRFRLFVSLADSLTESLTVPEKAGGAQKGPRDPPLITALGASESLAKAKKSLMALVDQLGNILREDDAAAKKQDAMASRWETRSQYITLLGHLLGLDAELFGIGPIQTELSNSLADPSYMARRAAPKSVVIIFHRWEKTQHIFSDLKLILNLASPAGKDAPELEVEETGVVAIAELAAGFPGLLEGEVLLLMLQHLAVRQEHSELVAAAVAYLASCLGYDAPEAYLTLHLPELTWRWVLQGHKAEHLLELLPVMAGHPDGDYKLSKGMRSLLSASVPHLMGALLLRGKQEEYQLLCEAQSVPVEQLLKNGPALGTIHASAYLLLASDAEATADGTALPGPAEARAVLDARSPGLEGSVSAKELYQAAAKFSDHVIAEMLLRTHDTPREPDPMDPPFFREDAVQEAVLAFVRASRDTLWEQVCPACIPVLLARLHEQLHHARHATHKAWALCALRSLLGLLGPQVAEPFVFQYVCQLLSELLLVTELQPAACEALIQVLEVVLQTGEERLEVAAVLQAAREVVAVCVRALCQRCASGKLFIGDGDPLVALLRKATVGVPEPIQQALAGLEDIPNLPVLEDVARLQRQARSKLTFQEELATFVANAHSQSRISRQLSSSSLIARLRQTNIILPTEELKQSTWQLVRLGADLADRTVSSLAAALLALCGPLDPTSIAFASPGADRSSAPGLRALPTGSKSPPDPLLPAVLMALAANLSDRNLAVTQDTHLALLTLLRKTKPSTLTEWLPGSVAELLQVFCCVQQEIPKQQITASTRWDLGSDKLWDLSAQSYSRWVCHLAYTLLIECRNPVLRACARIARRKDATAEALLPYILAVVACADSEHRLRGLLTKQVQKHLLSSDQQGGEIGKAQSLLISCLNCLRSCRLDAIAGPNSRGLSEWSGLSRFMEKQGVCFQVDWESDYWLELRPVEVAKAALACGATFTALLYVEKACDAIPDCHSIASLGKQDHEDAAQVERALMDIYSNINEPDSIFVMSGLCRSTEALLCLQQHAENWPCALAVADRSLQLSSPPAMASAAADSFRPDLRLWQQALGALENLGCSQVAGLCLAQCLAAAKRGLGNKQDDEGQQRYAGFRESYFEAAWRAGQWPSNSPSSSSDTLVSVPALQDAAGQEPGFHELLHRALAALRDGDSASAACSLEAARSGIVSSLSGVGVQRAAALNSSVVRLQMAQQLEEAWTICWPELPLDPNCGACALPVQLQSLQEGWARQREAAGAGGRFSLMEPMAALDAVLFQTMKKPAGALEIQLSGVRAARKAGQLMLAGNLIARLRASAEGLGTEMEGHGGSRELEEVKLLWAEGHSSAALQLVQRLSTEMQQAGGNDRIFAAAQMLGLAGKWQARDRSGRPNDILETMRQACALVESSGIGKVACRLHCRLAEYAYRQYRGTVAQQQSQEMQMRERIMHSKAAQIQELDRQLEDRKRKGLVKRVGTGYDEETRALLLQKSRKTREMQMDKQELQCVEECKAQYLQLTLTNYRKVIKLGTLYDLMAVFRLCSLWFTLGQDHSVNKHMMAAFNETPSHKFLMLVYQMASRMSSISTGERYSAGFYKAVQQALRRMAMEHPFHTLYQVFAIRNARRASPEGSGQHIEHKIDSDKVAAAEALISDLGREPCVQGILGQMELLLDAYIALSDLNPPSKRSETMHLPRDVQRRFKDLDLLPLASSTLPVRPDGAYFGTFPTIAGISQSISFVGGINMPKLIQVTDSEQTVHRELVKARDDLRQDAVMQQLFALVNSLLYQTEASRIRQLSIATYKVVPFTPNSGLLGWVEDTIPLAEYLIGRDSSSGAHLRYRPLVKNMSHRKAAETMRDARTKGGQHRASFDKVCEKIPPVFHHFFLEMYRHPGEWFERRLAYTRSMAVNSMIGYIIGLGDRHSNNILLKLKTAEVVHIDLGIAFEQGRLLPTPEQVPFRLTRDLVDGMGVSGYEGVMRRCSEAVLLVLRAHKDELLTIAEVLIHDPLYNWALAPKRAAKQQRLEEEEGEPLEMELGNADAQRAISRVKEKLEGTELGDGEPRGVEGQVQQLLQDATDPDKLCRMYEGWAAWL